MSYFDSEQAIAKLAYVAGLWQGTPWMPNSQQMNVGVACHNLPRALYISCGALPPEFPQIVGDPNGTKHKTKSVMEPFIAGRSEFRRLNPGETLKAGDLVGLRIRRCIDHLGVMISDKLFVHVLMHKKTDVDRIDVPPWSQHLDAAWRIE